MIRGPISFILVLTVLLGVIALVALGPSRVAEYLPEPVANTLLDTVEDLAALGAGTFGGMASIGGDASGELVSDTSDGLVARGPVAALAGNQPVLIDSVIARHSTRVADDIPAGITTIRPILGCLVTSPTQGSVVGHVTSGSSDRPLALATYNDTQLAKAMQIFVDVYRKTGLIQAQVPADIAYEVYDVAVTETAAPVYLVLENRFGNRIWNIHLAPGARIDRVVLLGGVQAGVANLDPVVPVEVLLNPGLAECGIAPAYPLNAGHMLFQSLESGALSAADANATLAQIEAAVAAYDQWFRDSFGVSAAGRAGFDQGAVSVVGPVPATEAGRAVYAPISGADIRTTQDTYFEIEGQVPEGQDFAARVRSIVTGFAFGDLATLRQGADF